MKQTNTQNELKQKQKHNFRKMKEEDTQKQMTFNIK